MIRAVLILLVVAVLGWVIGHASRPAAPADKPPVSVRDGDFSAIQARMRSEVVLYTLSSCPFSKEARAFLDSQGIEYAERDVGESLDARLEATSLGATTVPFMLIGDVSVEGFDQTQMMALLDEQRTK